MRKKLQRIGWLVGLSAAAVGGVADHGGQARAYVGSAKQRVFVVFKSTPGAAERALVKANGASVRHEFPDLGAIAVEIDGSKIAGLARDARIDHIEEDPPRFATDLNKTQLTPTLDNGLYGLLTTHAVDVQAQGITGSGIKIGVGDTGIDYTHPDIAPNWAGGIDVFDGDDDPFWDGLPGETHATHVAGTILAANNKLGVFGVAYGARLYEARVLGTQADGSVSGSTSDIMTGVQWLVETAGVKVVNLSLGGGHRSGVEEKFFEQMHAEGVLVVVAAGSDGTTRLSYPAAYPVNIAVAAVDRHDALASFSNTGRNLDVSAPGVDVLSSVPIGAGSEAAVTASRTTYYATGMAYAAKTDGITANLVNCGLGQAGECPASVSGNIALIQRGSLTLADNVTNAMNSGAVVAIVYNNVAGDFSGTLGAATTADGRAWIPTVGVSDVTGAALLSQSKATVVNKASSWDVYSGTSMATPHVTGVVALIWSANPGFSNTAVETKLESSCDDLGAPGYDTTFGFGRVNAARALASR